MLEPRAGDCWTTEKASDSAERPCLFSDPREIVKLMRAAGWSRGRCVFKITQFAGSRREIRELAKIYAPLLEISTLDFVRIATGEFGLKR